MNELMRRELEDEYNAHYSFIQELKAGHNESEADLKDEMAMWHAEKNMHFTDEQILAMTPEQANDLTPEDYNFWLDAQDMRTFA